MQLDVITDETSLIELRGEWHSLPCPTPMQGPDWLIPWWQAYSDSSTNPNAKSLYTLSIRDGEQRLRGLLPLYREDRRVLGPTLRLLGDGQACSDHCSIICSDDDQPDVIGVIADHLFETKGTDWQTIRFEAIDRDDSAMSSLLRLLDEREFWISEREDVGTCYVDLPSTWEAFLEQRSKNHRKRCRRWVRAYFDTARARVHRVTTPDDLERSWRQLVLLHNARRSSVGDHGAFSFPEFCAFHELATQGLLQSNQLCLQLLEIDGQIRAIEYAFINDDCMYAYQSGLDREGEEASAGNLSIISLIRTAIENGCTRLDLMRGQEPYKFHWGAIVRPADTVTLRSPSIVGLGEILVEKTRDTLRSVKHLCQRESG